jgi:hypothetical protein
MDTRQIIAVLVTVISLMLIGNNTWARQNTTASYNPAACSGGNNGTYNCTGSRGLETRVNSNPGRIRTNFTSNVELNAQPIVHSPTLTSNQPAVLNLHPDGYTGENGVGGGTVTPGTFDFRSRSMIQQSNGIRAAYQGRCPAVIRERMIVYYDCTSAAMIQFARDSAPQREPVNHFE